MQTDGRCPRCGDPYDDHILPKLGEAKKPICIPQRKR